MIFVFGVLVVGVIAGAIAAIAGFGIGSLLTPILSLSLGTKLAVAVVSFPHFIATGVRFWMLRTHVDKKILLYFGLTSVIGGLTGALLHTIFGNPALTVIFGGILCFAGFMGATNLSDKLRLHGATAWIAGAVSGFLGGLVGNQGGIRSAAMLGFNVPKESFVATATAVALIVDVARMPVYLWGEWEAILANGKWIALATVGTLAGTFVGTKLLRRLPEQTFRRIVYYLILLLGVFMLYEGIIS